MSIANIPSSWPYPSRSLARSLGYTGPRLASRPDLGSISALQVREAHGRAAFDDADARMAAYDAMEVTAAVISDPGDTPGGASGGASSSGSDLSSSSAAAAEGEADAGSRRWWSAGAWDAERWRLASFNSLSAPRLLLRQMKRARLNRPTPIQGCGPSVCCLPACLPARCLLPAFAAAC